MTALSNMPAQAMLPLAAYDLDELLRNARRSSQTVLRFRDGVTPQSVSAEGALFLGDALLTGDAEALVGLDDGTRIVLGPRTSVALRAEEDDRGQREGGADSRGEPGAERAFAAKGLGRQESDAAQARGERAVGRDRRDGRRLGGPGGGQRGRRDRRRLVALDGAAFEPTLKLGKAPVEDDEGDGRGQQEDRQQESDQAEEEALDHGPTLVGSRGGAT